MVLGSLDPARIAKLAADGRHLDGDPPSKEAFLHRCVYEMRGDAKAIVHLHSTHSVAVSCLAGIDADDVLPPLTAYYVMRVGKLPLIPYFPPGDERLAAAGHDHVGTGVGQAERDRRPHACVCIEEPVNAAR